MLHTTARLAGIAMLVGSAAMAQEADDLITDRPDQTESSRIVPARSVQIEVGTVYERTEKVVEPYDIYTGSIQLPGVLIRVGTGSWLELRGLAERSREEITFTERPRPPTFRFGNFGSGEVNTTFIWGLGAKVQLLDESGLVPETAFLGHIIVPEKGKPVQQEFRFSMSNTLSSVFDLGYNLGGEYDPNHKLFTFIYTMALGAGITDEFGGYIEVFGDWNKTTDDTHSVDAGLTWMARDNVQFDVSGGIGLTDTAPDYFIGAGFSVRFPR
jgi:hypothetical protein